MSKHSFRLTDKAETILKEIFQCHALTSEVETENWEKLLVEVLPLILYKNSTPPSDNQSEPERSTDLAIINENEHLESNYFDCALLCPKSPKCNRDIIRDKSEIKAALCYISRFPYYWTPKGSDKNPCRCSYATFKSSQPYGDPDDPYPECMAKQKDVPFQLPKDRIIRDPKLCWLCYNTHQKMQDDEFKKKYIRQSSQSFQRAPVDWGDSVGVDPDYSYR